MPGFPDSLQTLPLVDWPTSRAARAWVVQDVLPWSGLSVVVMAFLPLVLLHVWVCVACGARKQLPRPKGLMLTLGLLLASLVALGAALYIVLQLFGTFTGLESTAINATNAAAAFTCSDDQAAEATCASAHISTHDLNACGTGDASLIGFAEGLSRQTDEITSGLESFVSRLNATATHLAPVETSGADLSSLASNLSASLYSLNLSIASTGAAFTLAHTSAAPFFNLSDGWRLLKTAGKAVKFPPVKSATLTQVSFFATLLAAQHTALVAAIDNAEEIASERAGTINTMVAELNSTVHDEVASMVATFAQGRQAASEACTAVDSYWTQSGLPGVNGRAGFEGAVAPSPFALHSPAIEIGVAFLAALVLPLLLLGAHWLCVERGGRVTGTVKRGQRLRGCLGASLGASSLPSILGMLALSAVCLTLAPLLDATCEGDTLETMLRANLEGAGNVTLFPGSDAAHGQWRWVWEPPATSLATPVGHWAILGHGGASASVRGGRRGGRRGAAGGGGDSIAVSALVGEVAACGTKGHASNLVEMLSLTSFLDFASPLANLTSDLDAQLAAFNRSALDPIDAALASLGNVDETLSSLNSTADPNLDVGAVANLTALADFYDALLPAVDEPSLPGEREKWFLRFHSLYGSNVVVGPTNEIRKINERVRFSLRQSANQSASVVSAFAAVRSLSQATPSASSAMNTSLKAARAECTKTVHTGGSLVAILSTSVDQTAKAERVSDCRWVNERYVAAKSLVCERAAGQTRMIGLLLGVAGLLLSIATCALLCVRPASIIALDRSERTVGLLGGGQVDRPASALSYSMRSRNPSMSSRAGSSRFESVSEIVVERESPFAYYSNGRRAGQPSPSCSELPSDTPIGTPIGLYTSATASVSRPSSGSLLDGVALPPELSAIDPTLRPRVLCGDFESVGAGVRRHEASRDGWRGGALGASRPSAQPENDPPFTVEPLLSVVADSPREASRSGASSCMTRLSAGTDDERWPAELTAVGLYSPDRGTSNSPAVASSVASSVALPASLATRGAARRTSGSSSAEPRGAKR